MPFRIKHNSVGPWVKGQIVSREEIEGHAGGNVDVNRLLSHGAIEATNEKPAGVTPVGPENPTGSRRADNTRTTDEPGENEVVDYGSMSVADLKSLAEQREIPGYKAMKKDQLVEALAAADDETSTSDEGGEDDGGEEEGQEEE